MYTFSILPSNTPNVSLPVRISQGWSDQSWTKLYFSINRSSPFIEIYGSPGKYWLVRVSGCWLPIYSMKAPFSPQPPPGSGRMSGRSCGGILRLAGPIESQIGVRHCLDFQSRWSPANMAPIRQSPESANSCLAVLAVWASTESAERHIFHYDRRPLELGDHMLFQKLLVDVGVALFTGGKQPRWPKLLISIP
jgi:hypothetical protein